jgi:hypothetical protein
MSKRANLNYCMSDESLEGVTEKKDQNRGLWREICFEGQMWTILWSKKMFNRTNIDYCMTDETSEGVSDYVYKVQDRGLFGQKFV